MSRFPDFFIVGAPKCGTTALYQYLAEHPGIFMSDPKEPHYFADDISSPYYVRSERAYRALFAGAGEKQRIGEASVWYLFSSVAVRRIREVVPEARLIVMVRRPVDLFLSLHNQMLVSLYENEEDPEQAWRLQEARRQGRRVSKLCDDPGLLQYDATCRLGAQLERLLESFPRSRVRVITIDELVAEPRSVYDDTLRFLDLPSDGRSDFPRVNEAYRSRSTGFEALRRRVDRAFVTHRRAAQMQRWLAPLWPLSRAMRRLNQRSAERPSIDDSFRSELIEHFEKDVELLAELLERDLSEWNVSRLQGAS